MHNFLNGWPVTFAEFISQEGSLKKLFMMPDYTDYDAWFLWNNKGLLYPEKAICWHSLSLQWQLLSCIYATCLQPSLLMSALFWGTNVFEPITIDFSLSPLWCHVTQYNTNFISISHLKQLPLTKVLTSIDNATKQKPWHTVTHTKLKTFSLMLLYFLNALFLLACCNKISHVSLHTVLK